MHEVSIETTPVSHSFDEFVHTHLTEIEDVLRDALATYRSIKMQVRTRATFYRVALDGTMETTNVWFWSRMTMYSDLLDFNPRALVAYLTERAEGFNQRGSNWLFDSVEVFEIVYMPYRPLAGGSFIETPKHIANKHAILNIRNMKDNDCFLYCVLAGIEPEKSHHKNRVSPYRRRLLKGEIILFITTRSVTLKS
jgi:hypothetical protein